ncbi:hypothetical protein IHE55_18565 [Streptomyces pactum]|uniref:Glycerophosphoryl diester phosphodiesterase membrane domain-containing protein n=1 Tax=Streptomyces pactum TaxID=68249 RepID=A0ABS0NN94_9ACTN|nr:hypothetical protein [Streptomyces pactum]MBH5336669.1 hypothetical protein [Streptomyces pactum]
MNDTPGPPPGSSSADEPEDRGDGRRGEPGRPAPQDGPPQQPVWGAKWAERQPPAGRWTAPGGGTAPPPAVGGAPPGWGGGWAPAMTAPRPGTIPLRPLGVGEILDGAVATVRAHWRTVLGIALAVAVVTQTLATLATGLWLRDVSGLEDLDDDTPTAEQTLDAIGGTLGNGATVLIGVLATVAATALLTVVTGRAVLGRGIGAGEAWRAARPQLPRLCGLVLLLPLIVFGALLAGFAPGVLLALAGAEEAGAALALLGGFAGLGAGIWLWIRYSLAAPALMLEKAGVTTALRRSAKLVRGAWWRVFGIQLLVLVIVLVVEAVVEIPTSMVAMAFGGDSATDWLSGEDTSVSWTFLAVIGLGGVLSTTLTLPLTAGVTALLYIDQRIRREALDLELARATGVPADGVPKPPHGPGPGPDRTG